MAIHVTPIPKLSPVDSLTTPAFTLGTANAAGTTRSAVATDATLLAFDTTLPAAVAAASATGSAVVSARRDHVHAGSGFMKVGSFTRDTEDASGDQAVTGVGFTPKALLFIGGQNQSVEVAWGWADANTEFGLYDRNGNVADTYGTSTTRWGTFVQTGSLEYQGSVKSMDVDGFTIAWVRSGTPSGVLTLSYLALG